MDSQSFLDGLISELTSIKSAAETHFGNLTDEQLNWQPQPEKWSISQNLEHLILTGELYLTEIREAIKEGKNMDHKGLTFKYSWFGKFFVNSLKPNPKFKVTTFKNIDPGKSGRGRDSLDVFIEFQDKIKPFLEEAYQVDINRIKIKSPVFPLIRLKLGEAFEAVLTHEKRHLLQAQGVMKTLDFPTAKEAVES